MNTLMPAAPITTALQARRGRWRRVSGHIPAMRKHWFVPACLLLASCAGLIEGDPARVGSEPAASATVASTQGGPLVHLMTSSFRELGAISMELKHGRPSEAHWAAADADAHRKCRDWGFVKAEVTGTQHYEYFGRSTRRYECRRVEAKPQTPKDAKTKKYQFDADRIAALIDKRSHEPLDQPLTLSEVGALKTQIERCWIVQVGARYAEDLVVTVRVFLNPDGSLRREPQIVDDGRLAGGPFFRAVAESVIRALLKCEPFNMPVSKYRRWREIELTFDPRETQGLLLERNGLNRPFDPPADAPTAAEPPARGLIGRAPEVHRG